MIAPTMPDLLTTLRAHLVGDRRASRTIETYTKIAGAFLGTFTGFAPTCATIETFLAHAGLGLELHAEVS